MAVVAYFGNELTPGLRYFDCSAMRARLSTQSCAEMWRKANARGAEVHDACKRCPIGAAHAGEVNASTSNLCGSMICVRCHNAASRLICGRMYCVSCKNREYEFLHGRNAKGTTPTKVGRLTRRRVRFTAGGKPCQLSMALTADHTELVVATLRESRDQVSFGFGSPLPPVAFQLRLF